MLVFGFGMFELWGALHVCFTQLFQAIFVQVPNEDFHVGS